MDCSCVPTLLRNFPQERHGACCMTQASIGLDVNLIINLVTQNLRDFLVSTEPDRREMVDLNDPDFVVPVSVRSSVRITKREGCWAVHLDMNSLNISSTMSHLSRPSPMLSIANCFKCGTSY